MSVDDLDALVARAQAGDVRAFELLVGAELPKIRRFARAFASSEADADDLAQEALVRVYRGLRSFRWQAAFSTWLFAVVRSVCLDAGKGRAATRRAVERPLAEAGSARDEATPPDEALETEQERRRVWTALRQVPPEYRAALVLFDLEGHSYDEVAAVEGVAIGTVKSRLHRGRALLRRLLDAAAADAPGAGTSASSASSHVKGTA